MVDLGEWTAKRVDERLAEAADVMRCLPRVRVQGFFSTWPAIAHDFADRVGQEPQRLRRPSPAPDAITRAEATLLWLRWLEVEDARLVWMRAERARWREICQRFELSRATANRRYDYALTVIVWRLERRPLQQIWSRRFLLDRARILKDAS
jgi:flavin-binding protein dodecin